MEREDAKKLWPIIKAYAEGKNIEYCSHQKPNDSWDLILDPAFYGDVSNYRIAKEPKYRPFKDGSECWEEMNKHQPLGWIMSKNRIIYNIQEVLQLGIKLNGCVVGFDICFDGYVFADGAPFGIKEE